MDLIGVPFAPSWQALSALLLLPAVAWAAWTAPWRQLTMGGAAHAWCATILGVVLLWMARATLDGGFSFHLLGMSLLTLLVGPRLALVGSAIVVACVIYLRGGLWANFAIDVALMASLPILVTAAVLRVAQRRLPGGFPVYIFVVGFFGSALAMIVAALATAAAVILGGARPWDLASTEILPCLVYLGFAEATVTGMVLSAVIAAHPEAAATFSFDRHSSGR